MSSDRATGRSDAAHQQALRFLLVGATTVAIDFVVYQLLALTGVALTPAKAISFVVATVCAYLFNRTYTFGVVGGRRAAVSFTMLYAVTLVVNVGVNALGLELIPATWDLRVVAAFLCAQVVSSTINFFFMRHVVFATPAR
ncbi:MAG: GtrA family protein [Nocardioidaceae bacterium]|nr:GtrA family protein [Nocardioidaceae bacterium]